MPAIPSACRPRFAWRRASAFAVSQVNHPSTIDCLRVETEQEELELERRDVPADGTHTELALAEERAPERAERRPGGLPQTPAGKQTSALLKAHKAGTSERAVDPVDSRRVKAVSAQRHLEGSNARVGRGDSRPREYEEGGNRDRDGEQATHVPCVGTNRSAL